MSYTYLQPSAKRYVLGKEIWQKDLTFLGASFKKDDPIGDNKF